MTKFYHIFYFLTIFLYPASHEIQDLFSIFASIAIARKICRVRLDFLTHSAYNVKKALNFPIRLKIKGA